MISFGVPLQADVWYTLRIDLEDPLKKAKVTYEFGVYTVTDYQNIDTGIMIDDNKNLGILSILDEPEENT